MSDDERLDAIEKRWPPHPSGLDGQSTTGSDVRWLIARLRETERRLAAVRALLTRTEMRGGFVVASPGSVSEALAIIDAAAGIGDDPT